MVEKATRKKDENEDFIDYFCNVNVDTVYEIALQGRVKKHITGGLVKRPDTKSP